MKTRLLTTLIAVLLALTSWANGTKIKGIYYLLDNSTKTASVTFSGYDSTTPDETVNPISTAYKGSITIPTSVSYHGTTYSVTSIGEVAFGLCTSLTSVTIPNSVTTIGGEAFLGCSGLTSITIPNSVKSIGDFAFYNCTNLCRITIPNSVKSIGDFAFDNCGLSSVIIPNSVRSIGDAAFKGNEYLYNLTIGTSVSSIGEYAFADCIRLTNVTVLRYSGICCPWNTFSLSGVSYMTLHVPAGYKKNFERYTPWCRFPIIMDDAPTE